MAFSWSITLRMGNPLAWKITAPLAVSLERLNILLAELGELPLAAYEYGPVRAA
jgi:hypothetical protein